jgi:flagellum-specific peptidoglycan hydrolase FlgJ
MIISFFFGARYSDFFFTKEINNIEIIHHERDFSKEKLINLLKRTNLRYPHIVMAQSIVESGHFRSEIFVSNNNLFGMKRSTSRVTTSDSLLYGYAYYFNWTESVYDYAFLQATYLHRIKTEDDYFTYLSCNYAESEDYVKLLKQVIKRERLREIF